LKAGIAPRSEATVTPNVVDFTGVGTLTQLGPVTHWGRAASFIIGGATPADVVAAMSTSGKR
jgi:hypothetical protein